MCGEKRPNRLSRNRAGGSPPRVRGKANTVHPLAGSSRITPACAGKRRREIGRERGCEDHPRVCGEKSTGFFCSETEAGSPPRVRGKVTLKLFISIVGRITPACAGKSSYYYGYCWCIKDHPRVCGEKNAMERNPSSSKGSPPRVRGKEYDAICAEIYAGITPACAGKSFSTASTMYFL